MRKILILLSISFHSVYGQDTLKGLWKHELELSAYTVKYRYYGGTELNYGIGRLFGKEKQSEIGLRTGVFYIRREQEKQYSYIPTSLYYRYRFKSHNGAVRLTTGTPVFWLKEDSKIYSGTFWNGDEEEEFSIYRKRILLINQLEYEYYFNFGMGVGAGMTNYLTQASETSQSLLIFKDFVKVVLGFKLSVSYQF